MLIGKRSTVVCERYRQGVQLRHSPPQAVIISSGKADDVVTPAAQESAWPSRSFSTAEKAVGNIWHDHHGGP